jgi:hypothetical protein
MTWQDQLKGNPIPWLLEADSPGARYLTMRDILDLAEDDPDFATARKAAHQVGPIATVLNEMNKAGYWVEAGPGYNPKYKATVWAIILLAQLGATVKEDERIAWACRYLLDHAFASGGQFSASGAPSGTVDCLQGNLLWALTEVGFEDPKLDLAVDWMARSVTGEGVAPLEEKHAPLRYYAGKCGPLFACGANNKLPCAWGAVKVMRAFSNWAETRRTPLIDAAIEQGVNFLFSVDPVTANYPSGWNAKPSQNWWKFGFPVFYVTDILQIGEALTRLGFGNDPRFMNALAYIRDKQDSQGRWLLEYDYTGKTWGNFGEKKQPNKWVTLRALRVLKGIK